MTIVQVRVDPDDVADDDADLILDLYGQRIPGANVQWDSRHTDLLKGLSTRRLCARPPSTEHGRVLRRQARPARGRPRRMDPRPPAPTSRVESRRLRRAGRNAEPRDVVLSGDHWRLSFREHPATPPMRTAHLMATDISTVSPLSGGLDSLAGAVDQLASGDRVAFRASARRCRHHLESPKSDQQCVGGAVRWTGRCRPAVPATPSGAVGSGLHHALPRGDREGLDTRPLAALHRRWHRRRRCARR